MDLQKRVEESIRRVFLKRWPHTQIASSLIEQLVGAVLTDKVTQECFLEVKYRGLLSTREKIKEFADREARLVEALRFYANEKHYDSDGAACMEVNEDCSYDNPHPYTRLAPEMGEIARTTLKELGIEEGE